MKKILFYVPSLSPSGGIERVVTTIANKLSMEFNVTILTKDTKISFYELDDNIELASLNYPFTLNMTSRLQRIVTQVLSVFNCSIKIRAYLKRNNFDYVYVTHPLSHFELLLAGYNYKKLVISEHGSHKNYNYVYRVIKRLTYRWCKAYCVPTKLDCTYYENLEFPVVYTPHYRPKLKYVKSNLKHRVVLNIGRFTSDKKQLDLLKIWSSISEINRYGWKLHLVGDGELKGELLRFIEEEGLSDSVKILPPIQCVDKYYKESSIFALTSSSEGFGMVLLEAAGFGLPLISFDCPSGPRDIITINNGFLVNINDHNEYQDKLIKMMSNRELLCDLGDGAYRTANSWTDDNITYIWQGIFE